MASISTQDLNALNPVDSNKIVGIVLNGGQSSRMGLSKANLPLDAGRTMIEHVVSRLSIVCHDIYIVGGELPECDQSLFTGHFPDDHPGRGPTEGLATVWRRKLAEGYLVLTCDQPLLTPTLLSRLLDGDLDTIRYFRDNGTKSFMPFPGYYPQAALDNAFGTQGRDVQSMRMLIALNKKESIVVTDYEAAFLKGANTPSEYAVLLGDLNSKPGSA